jgi:hypothetical protein
MLVLLTGLVLAPVDRATAGTRNFRSICRITDGDPAPQPQVPSR